MRVNTKGQVTIPVEIRERFGLLTESEVEFVVQEDVVQLRRVDHPGPRRENQLISRLRGRAKSATTTDEILALTRQQ